MQIGFLKGLKPKFIKQMALLMSICYVLNLLQFQISPALHSISHILEAPENMISHHSESSSEYEMHLHGDHNALQEAHEHEIIDLLDSILESSKDQNNSDETLLSELKFDKHIRIEIYQKKVVFETEKSQPFFQKPHKSKKGHFEILEKPPQLS